MADAPSRDFDDLTSTEILDLAQKVQKTWSGRDEKIARATQLRKQDWEVPVPDAWKQTAKTQHSSLAKEIPTRVTGTMALRDPVFSRMAQDDDMAVEEQASRVERFCAAYHQWNKRSALPGKNAWVFTLDQLINKGAVCTGSIFAPHDWANAPIGHVSGSPELVQEYWRDDQGRPTSEKASMNPAASSRAYEKVVDLYRRTAKPPISRRILQTEQAYPLFIEGEMMALFVIRKASTLDVTSGGYILPTVGSNNLTARDHELIEVWTPNRVRYFFDKSALGHEDFSADDGLVTNYGFVPFTYRVGLEGGDLDYGSYGEPLLSLVDTNIRMIDTMLTYQFNAIHLASFTSFQLEYDTTKGNWDLVEGDTGRSLTSFDFRTGTIMDFGPYKKVVPLTHPGLNKDFDAFLKFQIEEVNRIIPRTLQGVAESSGYNTAQTSVQAKAIFSPIAMAAELIAADQARMDLQHIAKRVPGPVYLNLEQPKGLGSKPKKVSRIGITADDIADYYDISATIDQEMDRVTLGSWGLQMMTGGVGDDEWVSDLAGIEDYGHMIARRARQRVLNSPQIMAAVESEAVEQFGLQKAVAKAAAAQRIQQGPDGTPMVKMPDGRMAGPGQGQPTMPQAQGAAGAALGGLNTAAAPGLPNLAATNNPQIETPGGRMRRRGGALPGVSQNQNSRRPMPSNPAA